MRWGGLWWLWAPLCGGGVRPFLWHGIKGHEVVWWCGMWYSLVRATSCHYSIPPVLLAPLFSAALEMPEMCLEGAWSQWPGFRIAVSSQGCLLAVASCLFQLLMTGIGALRLVCHRSVSRNASRCWNGILCGGVRQSYGTAVVGQGLACAGTLECWRGFPVVGCGQEVCPGSFFLLAVPWPLCVWFLVVSCR